MKYEDVTQQLLNRIPHFAEARKSDLSFMSHDDDSPYLVFGDFALFLLGCLKTAPIQTQTASLLQQAFELLNEMLLSPNPEVANLAYVGVLEILADAPEGNIAIGNHLTSDAITVYYDYGKKSHNAQKAG